jgi:co-chaperonin GroES (HSP10)
LDKYCFKYAEIDPLKLPPPIGDRYLLEMIDYDDDALPHGLVLPQVGGHDLVSIPIPALVLAAGNGHRLETSDPAVVMPETAQDPTLTPEQRRAQRAAQISYIHPAIGDNSVVFRPLATVPMFFAPGQVIFVEKYSGREFHLKGRTYRYMNQVDCLGWTGVVLSPRDDGDWEVAPPPTPATPIANGKSPRLYVPS